MPGEGLKIAIWYFLILLWAIVLLIYLPFKILVSSTRGINPDISFLLVVHNQEQIIEGLLRRLLPLQHHEKLLDFEIMVIDNGSTDQSGTILEALADTTHRFRLSRLAERKVNPEREMLEYCRGSVICCVDLQDQVSLRSVVKSLYRLMKGEAAHIPNQQITLILNQKDSKNFEQKVVL